MTQELRLDPALRARMAVGMFRTHVGAHDWALLVKKHGQAQAEAFAKPYERFVDTIVGLVLAEGGTLPQAALVDVDPLA